MKFFISILALALAAVISFSLYANKPKTEKKPPERTVPIVKTLHVQPASEQVFLEAYGTVIPARQIKLSAEVSGRVIRQNPEMVPGGVINKDDFILEIEPADYTLQVQECLAELANAQYELELEEGRQTIARQEWLLLEKDLESSLASKSLALREPHLKHAQAKLDAAKSRLEAAELDLQRTTIRSPFHALVLEEFVEHGQILGQQTPIATLAGADHFWIQVSIPASLIPRITFPNGPKKQGSTVEVLLEEKNGGTEMVRHGKLFKLLGDLDPKGRMARILISIEDPLNLSKKPDPDSLSKILLGSYIKVRIDAGVMENVYTIPRQAIREGDRLWVVNENGILDIRPAQIRWRRVDEMLVSAEIKPGEEVIISRLQSPLPGMTVRLDRGNGVAKTENSTMITSEAAPDNGR
ncbi:MAG: efflux RND transporter periplasmic adaptor subunit [Desulfobulbaceae bacterium]|uniref:Efflux RND transporter periplasmic adaptor subunit n=1 Tax=Candidatus Desulfobia pelagia TaxID=2841692 RepID=A0A8J6NCW5_9BACT|nr:efflux RND transporter periplasmic adaptor subunit [Candidatus Desulfobia pelagia]